MKRTLVRLSLFIIYILVIHFLITELRGDTQIIMAFIMTWIWEPATVSLLGYDKQRRPPKIF